jgi:hypothetical protein
LQYNGRTYNMQWKKKSTKWKEKNIDFNEKNTKNILKLGVEEEAIKSLLPHLHKKIGGKFQSKKDKITQKTHNMRH